MSSFAVDTTLFLLMLPCIAFFVWLYRYSENFKRPHIFVSLLEAFNSPANSFKEKASDAPKWLKLLALSLLVIAFIDPKVYFEKSSHDTPLLSSTAATEGIAIYLVLDQSGSMAEKVTVRQRNGQMKKVTKVDLLKEATKAFISGDTALGLKGRSSDMIGLVEFARTAQVIVPLTLDRNQLLEAVANFNVVPDRNQDGTAIGYAIFKTLQLIEATRMYARDLIGKGKPAYEIKNSVIILITDGLQDPNPLDKGSRWRHIDPQEVAHYIKEQGITLYIVNIEPNFNAEKYAASRRILQKTAETTGGKLYTIGNDTTLTDIYTAIEKIEKSELPIQSDMMDEIKKMLPKEKLPGLYHTVFISPYLIALAIITLVIAIILQCTVLRRAP